MLVPALVLIVAALTVGAAGALARRHRLPRNRVLGIRTAWTMSRVDAFRRANRAAAPAFLAAGGAGVVAGVVAVASPSTATGVTVLLLGAFGLLALTAVAGVVGGRFAEADEAEIRGAAAPGPCTSGAADGTAEEACDGGPGSGAADDGACVGSCALCPRAPTAPPAAQS